MAVSGAFAELTPQDQTLKEQELGESKAYGASSAARHSRLAGRADLASATKKGDEGAGDVAKDFQGLACIPKNYLAAAQRLRASTCREDTPLHFQSRLPHGASSATRFLKKTISKRAAASADGAILTSSQRS